MFRSYEDTPNNIDSRACNPEKNSYSGLSVLKKLFIPEPIFRCLKIRFKVILSELLLFLYPMGSILLCTLNTNEVPNISVDLNK